MKRNHPRWDVAKLEGYSEDTVRIQWGYSEDKVRIQWGYSKDTVGIQRVALLILGLDIFPAKESHIDSLSQDNLSPFTTYNLQATIRSFP